MDKQQSQSLVIPETFNINNTEVNKANLLKLREEDTKHMVKGIDDTKGYKKAIELRAKYRSLRIDLETYRTDISQPINKFLRDLKKKTDGLGDEAKKGEDYFDEQIKSIDNEKVRIKAEKEAEQQRIIQQRIAQLYALGARFDGESYTFDYDESLHMVSANLSSATEDKFNHWLSYVQESYDKEQQRIEKERLDREQAEAELEAAKAKLLEQRTLLRQKELSIVYGLICDENGNYAKPNTNILIGAPSISCVEDDVWVLVIEEIANYKYEVPEPVVESPLQMQSKYKLKETADGVPPQELIEILDKAGNVVASGIIDYTQNGGIEAKYDPKQAFNNLIDKVDASTDSGRVEITVVFFKDKPYYEFELSNKLTLRIYPYHYEEQAVSDISNIVKSGNIQDKLYYTVLKK